MAFDQLLGYLSFWLVGWLVGCLLAWWDGRFLIGGFVCFLGRSVGGSGSRCFGW